MSPVLMQVLAVLLMVPADPSVKKFFSFFRLPVTGINISGIIEFLEDPVMPADLFPVNGICPFLRMEHFHGISVVHMALTEMQSLAFPFSGNTICNMDLHSRCSCFQFLQHRPAYHCHVRGILQEAVLWLPSVKDPVLSVVCRGVALFTGCCKVCRPVGAVPFPVPHMVYMEEGTVFYAPSAELAGMAIPEEYGCTQGVGAVLFPSLVVFPMWEWFTLQDCF